MILDKAFPVIEEVTAKLAARVPVKDDVASLILALEQLEIRARTHRDPLWFWSA